LRVATPQSICLVSQLSGEPFYHSIAQNTVLLAALLSYVWISQIKLVGRPLDARCRATLLFLRIFGHFELLYLIDDLHEDFLLILVGEVEKLLELLEILLARVSGRNIPLLRLWSLVTRRLDLILHLLDLVYSKSAGA
jgi:hypothetical protein